MSRAVIFDWGAVLMRTVDIRPRMAWERQLGLFPWDLASLFFDGSRWEAAQRGQATMADAWDEVGRHLNLSENDLTALSRDFWAGDRLDPDLVALIRDLRSSGLQTALLSNFSPDLAGILTDLDLEDLFNVVTISGREGVMKPDPAIYQLALQRLNVEASDAVFVDDQAINVEAARQIGMTAIRFQGAAHLRRALAASDLPVTVRQLHPVPDIRAVIFDWGGVFSPLTFRQNTKEWEERLNLEAGTLSRVLWGRAWKQYEVGAITSEAYDRHVARGLGLPDREAVRQFYESYYADDTLDERVVQAAQTLRGRYKVAMLTNAFPGHGEMSKERYGFDPRTELDLYVNSAEVGLAKPDPTIYQLVLDRLGVTPQQAVFVDDMVRNTDAAHALGIHTLVFVDPVTGLTDLAALLGTPVLPDPVC